MAKSNFEPKKIVRYAESNIPKNGISSRPTPAIKATPSAAQAAVVAAVEAPAQPAPTPTPPPPAPEVFNYTGSFSFDGATELTGSYSHEGGRNLYNGTLHTTISPGWGQEETGSFTLLTIKNRDTYSQPILQYNRTFAIERQSGSDGYKDMLVCSISSGSTYYTYKGELDLSPNFYSGSGGTNEEIFLETFFNRGSLLGHRINGQPKGFKSTTVDYDGSVQNLANLALQDVAHFVCIGGTHSTPNNFYKGSMANIAITKLRAYYFKNGSFGDKAERSAHVDVIYRFEGNTSASKGNKDLDVIGTETYISSSL